MPQFAPQTFRAWFIGAPPREPGRAARSCCGRTRSTISSTRRPRWPRSRCWRRPASRRSRRRSCAAAGRSTIGHARHAPTPCCANCSTRSHRRLSRASRSSPSSRPASRSLRDELPALFPDDETRPRLREKGLPDQRISRRQGDGLPAAATSAARRWCRCTATTRRLRADAREKVLQRSARRRGPGHGLLRHGRLVRLRSREIRVSVKIGEHALLPRRAKADGEAYRR